MRAFRTGRAKLLLIWLGFAVSALFTYLAVRDVHFGRVWESLRASDYWWTIPSLALIVVALVVRALRWQYLFAPETRPPFRPVFNATLLGQFFNNVLPARAGEAARIIALNQSARTSRVETAATVVVERAYDVLSLLLLLFVLVPWLPKVRWLRAAEILAVVVTVGIIVAALLLWRFGDRPLRFLLRPLSRLPFIAPERVERAASNFVRGAAALCRPHLALTALVLTISSWLLLGLSAWLLIRGFDLGLSFGAGQLVIVAVGLSMILPSSPAAVGVFEAATLVALSAYDIPDSEALSYALVLHAVNFVPYVVGGIVVLHFHTLSLRREVL
jgi:hypothetical protein